MHTYIHTYSHLKNNSNTNGITKHKIYNAFLSHYYLSLLSHPLALTPWLITIIFTISNLPSSLLSHPPPSVSVSLMSVITTITIFITIITITIITTIIITITMTIESDREFPPGTYRYTGKCILLRPELS